MKILKILKWIESTRQLIANTVMLSRIGCCAQVFLDFCGFQSQKLTDLVSGQTTVERS